MPRKPRQKAASPTSTPVKRQVIKAGIAMETGNGRDDGSIWLSRIAKTHRLRLERRNGEKDWRRYYLWFEGEMWMERGDVLHQLTSDNARQTATVNSTGSIALSFMPFLINGQIKFHLQARKQSDVVSADIQQGLLNYEWGERDMTRQVKKIVSDVVIIGHGIGKSGYTVEVDEGRKKSDGEIVYADYIKKDAPYIERVDPLAFLFDLSAKDGSLHTARWCAEQHFVPYNDVMANSSYDQEVLQMIHTGAYTLGMRAGFEGVGSNDPIWSKQLTRDVPEDHLCALWEIWDKKYKKRYIYAEGVPWPLLEESWPYDYLDNFPYVKIDFIPVPNEPYGMGIMRQAEDQQMQLNRIRTGQFLHIRSHNRKFQALAGAVEPDEMTKFTDGPDGTVVTVNQPDAIKPIQDAPMSQDFQIIEGRIQADIEQTTGADALLQGRQLPSRTTAGEVSTRTNILRLKAEDRVEAIEHGVEDLANQVLHHLKKHRTLDDVVRIVGKQGVFWKEYTSDEIQADVDVSVEYFAAPKYDPAVDRQQRLQILQIASQAMPVLQQTGGPQVDFGQLLAWVLESFDQRDIGRFLQAAAAPRPPLPENEATTTPALGGALAPGQVPEQPGVEQPGEGLDVQSLLAGLSSQAAGIQ